MSDIPPPVVHLPWAHWQEMQSRFLALEAWQAKASMLLVQLANSYEPMNNSAVQEALRDLPRPPPRTTRFNSPV